MTIKSIFTPQPQNQAELSNEFVGAKGDQGGDKEERIDGTADKSRISNVKEYKETRGQ
jgi:hypothetical protein